MRYLLLLLLLLNLGCTPQPKPPLLVGTNLWPGYEPLYLARDLGWVPKTDVHYIEYGSSTEVMRAFRNGVIDAAALTLDEALLLAQYIPDIRIVLVLDTSRGGDAILAGSQLQSLTDLRGRRVGVESTAVGAYALARALELNHMTPADIIPVSLPMGEHEQAYLRGEVDAVVSCEPVRSKLIAQGAQVLFDSRQIPDEIIDVLVVRPDRMSTHREHLALLIRGWFKALTRIHSRPREVAAGLGAREGLTGEEFLGALRGLNFPSLEENRLWLSGRPSRLDLQRKRLTEFMRGHGLLEPAGSMPQGDASMLLQVASGANPAP